MLDYRRIRFADVQGLVDLAVESLPAHPTLVVSPEKIRNVVAYFATRHDHFQMAAFDDGVPVAGLAAMTQEMPYHDKCEATIMFAYSKVPGAGFRLLRMLMRWVLDDGRIRRLSWCQNEGFDQRIVTLGRRLGFQSAVPVLMFYKG